MTGTASLTGVTTLQVGLQITLHQSLLQRAPGAGTGCAVTFGEAPRDEGVVRDAERLAPSPLGLGVAAPPMNCALIVGILM